MVPKIENKIKNIVKEFTKKIELVLFRELRLNSRKQLKSHFLVKFLNWPYLSCEWLEENLMNDFQGERKMINFLDRQRFFKYRRLKRQILTLREKGINDDRKLPYFNPEYLRIDLIITRKTDLITMYYIKWSGQSYENSTWEQEKYIYKCQGFKEAKELFWLQEKLPSKNIDNLKLYTKHSKRGQKVKLDNEKTYKNGHKLKKNYQVDGREWLIHNYHEYIPCILADEMGLGKTVQTISFIEYLINSYVKLTSYLH